MALTLAAEHATHVLRTLNSYANSVSILGRLVAELESLHGLLDCYSEDLKASLYDQWTVLEEVYAVAVDRELNVLDEASEKLVEETNSRLRVILEKMVCHSLNGPPVKD